MNERKDILERVKHLMKENSEIKERFNGSEIKLATDMADYIIKTNQKEPFAEFQRQKNRAWKRTWKIGGIYLFDMREFDELIKFRGIRTNTDNEQQKKQKGIEDEKLKEIEEQKEFIESRLDKETLPEDYFFSALAELVLDDDR